MAENHTEEEQIEDLKRWWNENKTFVISGLALGASILFGWNYYKNQKLTKAYDAGVVHQTLVASVKAGDADAAKSAAERLTGEFASTAYAQYAPLAVAKLNVDAGDLDAAAAALAPALNGPEELALIARARLARIRLAQGRAQDALDQLSVDGGAYQPLFDEMRGDAYAELGQPEAARDAYNDALDSDGTAVDRNFVQVKLAALGLGVDDTP